MNLKIGDKVRIVKFPSKDMVGCIAEVIDDTEFAGFSYEVRLLSNVKWTCYMLKNEIEKLVPVGQQLLFSFMSEVI